ncbi:ROK family protein [Desulfotomaculum copahuensis]|uniref:ROK family protein n=1 Tax=Desulfotomaculum copahuensis TaxID=1838280 RepID=UPI000B20A1D8|nr:ROK family protein [Desulfotomaculum copahuensis]
MPEQEHNLVLGVDLGGTKIYTALADHSGRVLSAVKVPTGEHAPENVIARIVQTVEEVRHRSGIDAGDICALGAGAPGPLDPVRGIVHQAPNLGWHDVPLKALLEDALQLPVAVDNDANLAALGEYVYGAGRGEDDMVYITVSTGIGGGLIFGGRLYHGAGGGAGEIGHMTVDPDGPLCSCGNRGCLEALASGTAIARAARELVDAGGGAAILAAAGGRAVSAETVAAAAAAGDAEASGILTAAGRVLGCGVANLVNLLNPGLVVLGGGAMQAGRLLWQAMEDELQRRALSHPLGGVRLAPAALGSRSGVLGAVALALRCTGTG